MNKPRPRQDRWIYLALFLTTLAVYSPVLHFDFVNFDDPEFISHNRHVRDGVTSDNLLWALTSGEGANWFPVTRLSHLLDGQLFGLQSELHHLSSVLIHALATLLLFAFLNRSTRARWPGAFVAFLFALHPLHVESVAWVAERKDVLAAFFWFLTLYAYLRYTEHPSWIRYLLVLFPFCLGLMAKPMILTLPFVLLLLDVWPLRRAGLHVREKIPFFALTAVAAVATYFVQRASGAVDTVSAFPLGLRIGNALVTYVIYIAKFFWPSGLAVFYPYPAHLPLWQPVLAALAAISAFVFRLARSYSYLAVGWLWFLGTLVPVIGLVQVGAQSRADRYMYVPMVGLALMLSWGAGDLLRRLPQLLPMIAAGACAACITLTWLQLQYWRNSEALFRHALDVTDRNYVAHHNLGNALMDTPGRLPEAIAQFEASLRVNPNSLTAHTDLGSALSRIPGRLPDAVAEYRAALRINPESAIPHNNLGNTLSKIPGRLPDAIAEYQTALRIQPDYLEAHNNLGSALAKMGRLPEAIAQFQAALRLEPRYAEAHNNLGMALSEIPGRLPEAIAEYQEAIRINPDYSEARNHLGAALAHDPSRLPEAIAQYEEALRNNPDSADAHYNLGLALTKSGDRLPDAITHFEAALRLRPDSVEAHNNLGVALSHYPARLPEAIAQFEEALRIDPNDADAHYNLGVALSDSPGRLRDAIVQFEAAQRLKPDPELERLISRLRRSGPA